MPWRPQPADLVYAPPAYPAHGYTGQGRCWTVTTPTDAPVGHLTVQPVTGPPEAVGWDAAPPKGTTEAAISDVLWGVLRYGAAQHRALPDAIADILATVQTRPLEVIDLTSLRAD